MSLCFWEEGHTLLATWRQWRHGFLFLVAGGQPDPQFDTAAWNPEIPPSPP